MYNEAKIKAIKASKPFKLADIIMYVVAAVLIGLLFLLLALTQVDGRSIAVYSKGRLYGTYELTSERQEIDVDGVMLIVIENGTARVYEVDCPDQLCKLQGVIRFEGQNVVCLPNGIKIVVQGDFGLDGSI